MTRLSSALFLLALDSSTIGSAAAAVTKDYDFVIVGGGTAGCALAARICSGLPFATIAILERGTPRSADDDFLQQTAGDLYRLWDTPSLTENFESELNYELYANIGEDEDDADEVSFGRSVRILTGNTLGGTTSTNGNQWTVPPLQDVEAWGIAGLKEDVASAYYQKAADMVQPEVSNWRQNQSEPYIEAVIRTEFTLRQAATSIPNPLNSTFEYRIAHDALTGKRRDSATVYLMPALQGACASTLTLIQSATVSKILVRDNKAVGVEYIDTNDQTTTVAIGARKEVIISAGPYHSPKLLQLSGIGPRAVLEDVGIPLIKDLPVGANTQGRPVALIVGLYNGPVDWSNRPELKTEQARRDFLDGKGGIYAVPVAAAGVSSELGYIEPTFNLGDSGGNVPVFISACVLNSVSRGNLTVADTNPFSPPNVTLNLYQDSRDLSSMVRCLEEVVRPVNKEFGSTVEISPGLGTTLEDSIRSDRSPNAYHFVSGCPVGSVVDDELRVFGIGQLRVIDASVIPNITRSSGPMASVYLIAEFMSEKIVREYESSFSPPRPGKIGKRGKKGSNKKEGRKGKDQHADKGKRGLRELIN